ncbi:MAG: tetratricopeptide repeat protein [Woeseiaceae bacterium]|nr:tetratricopeptide repeat protein [Woeseiaceae bacterium]
MPATDTRNLSPAATLCVVLALAWFPPAAADTQPADAYAEAMAAGLFAEAETLAKERLEAAIAAGRREALDTAELFSDLARAQRLKGDIDAARQNYELAVELIEARRDMLDPALVRPLRGIAETHIDARRPDLALPFIDRALHVRQVNEGPHSLGQAPALELLVTAHRQMGELDEAAAAAERLHFVYARAYPGKRMEVVPALLRKGRAYGEMGDRRKERDAYERAAAIVRHNEGDASPHMIEPLIHLGRSHQDEYFIAYVVATAAEELPDDKLLREAQDYFESAREIAARADPDQHWELIIAAELAAGDFHTLKDDAGPAGIRYREAWRLLTVYDEKGDRRRREFESVVPLLEVLPDLSVALPFNADTDGALPRYDTGVIVTQFTITRRGRTKDIGLVDITPSRNDAVETEVKKSLRRRVYRPRFENGFAVDAPGQTIRYEFPVPRSAAEAR